MNLFRTGEPGEEPLTSTEQMYLDLIDASIKEEMGKQLQKYSCFFNIGSNVLKKMLQYFW